MRLKAFIDESGTHADAPRIIIGCCWMTEEGFAEFDREWRAMIADFQRDYPSIDHIHAVDVFGGNKQFKGIPWDRRVAMGSAVDSIIRKHALMQVSVDMLMDDFRTHYRGEGPPKGGTLHSAYGLSLRVLIQFLAEWIAEKRPGEIVDLIIEGGAKNEGAAKVHAEEFKRVADETLRGLIGKVAYVEKRESTGAQAADVVAYATFRLANQNKLTPLDAEVAEIAQSTPEDYTAVRLPIEADMLAKMRADAAGQ